MLTLEELSPEERRVLHEHWRWTHDWDGRMVPRYHLETAIGLVRKDVLRMPWLYRPWIYCYDQCFELTDYGRWLVLELKELRPALEGLGVW